MVDFDHYRSISRSWLWSHDYKVRRPDVCMDIRDRYTATIKQTREHVRIDTACTGCKCGSGCTWRTPHVFLARRRRPSRSRNVPVSGTHRVLKSGSRGRAKFRRNNARPSLVGLVAEYASGIKSTAQRSLSVCQLTGCIHANRMFWVTPSGGGGGIGALFIAVTRFLAASFTEFFHSELLSAELSAQAPANIFG